MIKRFKEFIIESTDKVRVPMRMEMKMLDKYRNSRINGILIRSLFTDDEDPGRVVIQAENGEYFEYWVEPDVSSSNADYIICDLQDNVEIKVNKR